MAKNRDDDNYVPIRRIDGLGAYTVTTAASGLFLVIATVYITNQFIDLAPINAANNDLIYVLVLCTLLSFVMVWSSTKKVKVLIDYYVDNHLSLADIETVHLGGFRKTRAVDLTLLKIASTLPLIFMAFTALQMRELNRNELLMQSGIIVWYCALFVLLAVIALFGFVSRHKFKVKILNAIEMEKI